MSGLPWPVRGPRALATRSPPQDQGPCALTVCLGKSTVTRVTQVSYSILCLSGKRGVAGNFETILSASEGPDSLQNPSGEFSRLVREESLPLDSLFQAAAVWTQGLRENRHGCEFFKD